jgi:[NiFe] hydrogenase assembly HybE family chaperone
MTNAQTAPTPAANAGQGPAASVAAATPDPSAPHPRDLALEAVFEDVRRTRMADLPFLNPALRVEAVGFRDWQGARVGALITPWSIVIVVMPDAAPEAVRRLPTGQSQEWTFPSGVYEFHGHEEPTLGHYQQCSLFSPAMDFASHEDARTAAHAALDALFAAPAPPPARKFSRRGLLTGG